MTRALLTNADALLRGSGLYEPTRYSASLARWLILIVLVFAPFNGAMMGSYELDSAQRWLQVAYSAVKLPFLLFATGLVCLPGFFVLNTVLGLRDDLRESLRAILAGQAALSIVLAALAPLTRFYYFCDISYRGALLFNAAMLAVATLGAQAVMLRYYRPLIRRNVHHRITLIAWLVLYAFVGIQMGWILRPFVGARGMAVTFFREEAFTNAYVVVANLLTGAN